MISGKGWEGFPAEAADLRRRFWEDLTTEDTEYCTEGTEGDGRKTVAAFGYSFERAFCIFWTIASTSSEFTPVLGVPASVAYMRRHMAMKS